MFESPDLDKRLIIDTFSPISNRFQESYDKKITILSERATSPIDFDTKKSKLHDVSIQTVCDQEIQTNLCNPGERKTSRAVEIESLSSSDMKPRNYLHIKAERLPKRYFDTSQSKETTKNHLKIPIKRLEDQLVPEKYLRSQYLNSKSSRNLNYNHAFKEHSEEELNSLRSEVSALSSSIRILTGKSSLKSSPQMQLSSSSVYDSLYHNPLLAESLEGSSRVQSILKKSSNYELSAIETPHDLDVNNSQSFRLNDLVFSNIKQAAPDISHKFYDDKLFELVEDLENMEDNKLSVSQTHKSSSKTKFQFDSKLMSIIDNFEMEDESLEYSQSLMNSKRSNHKEDSFEGLREKAVNLRKDIRK